MTIPSPSLVPLAPVNILAPLPATPVKRNKLPVKKSSSPLLPFTSILFFSIFIEYALFMVSGVFANKPVASFHVIAPKSP